MVIVIYGQIGVCLHFHKYKYTLCKRELMNTSGNQTHWLAFALFEFDTLTDMCMSSCHSLYLLIYMSILLHLYITSNCFQEIKMRMCGCTAGTLLFS